ncbi:MAG: pyruvate formate lyase-activating protein [Clostridia bacterium]|nr:pyruvate formate lyase-activating protein [Clostridia bacterium]
MVGRVHSIQTLGTLDGPGVRFVLFLQGCNLRCGCCHNPDTWAMQGGQKLTATEIVQRAMRYRTYFGREGGITVSGGEPLLQAAFVTELFALCHENGIHTCLDTSGSVLGQEVDALLDVTDRVLLDIKYPTDGQYRQFVGCPLEKPLAFLQQLNEKGIATTLRQVVIPTLNDTEESMAFLATLRGQFACVDKVELLPFKKICKTKYDQMGMEFPFEKYDTPTAAQMAELQKILEK